MRNKPFIFPLIVAGAFTASALLPSAVSATDGAEYPTVTSLKIEIRGPSGTSNGSCVLINRSVEGSDLVGYFLTAQRLFDRSDIGSWRPHELRVRLFLDDTTAVDANGNSVTFPDESEGSLGLALIAARLPRATDGIAPVSFASSPITTFVFKEHGSDWSIVLTGRAGSASPEPAKTAERAGPDLTNCLGAAAIAEAGVFGIATECTQGRPSVITLLSTARTFLARVMPTGQSSAAATPEFRLEKAREHRNIETRTFYQTPLPRGRWRWTTRW
jgi:hypothetical protein